MKRKFLTLLGFVGLCGFFGIAAAYAETQNVKVSGSLDMFWFYRDNFDFNDGNDIGYRPVGSTTAAGTNGQRSDADGFFSSITQVQIEAQLTNNVSTVVNLVNQRDWNADTLDGADTNGAAANTSNDEFDVMLDLAYVQLKQIFYDPLTLIIGRQDISYGRGFVVGTNPQNPGTAFQATDYSAAQSFDAIRAVLDFAPWTVDSFYSKVMENHTNPEDDRDLFGVNVNYQFSEYNGVAEMYYFGDIDRGANSATAALGTKTNETHSLGGRVQLIQFHKLH